MLCAIYSSPKKEGMYLYVEKRDQFDAVPAALREVFGKPKFVMLFNLAGEKQLKRVTNQEILQKLHSDGFYLQMPEITENLHTAFVNKQLGF